jgi:hypothetical protein
MAEAAMSNIGQAAAPSSICATLSTTIVSCIDWKVAVATALPQTSCAQVTCGVFVTTISNPISCRSRLSRGRSIKRCGPKTTALR